MLHRFKACFKRSNPSTKMFDSILEFDSKIRDMLYSESENDLSSDDYEQLRGVTFKFFEKRLMRVNSRAL